MKYIAETFSNTELNSIIDQINSTLPQLKGFISRFNTLIIENNINVTTDGSGNFSADVLSTMPDEQADRCVKELGVIDNLIDARKNSISELFKRGFALEKELMSTSPGYTRSPSLLEKYTEFKKISDLYKH